MLSCADFAYILHILHILMALVWNNMSDGIHPPGVAI